MRRSEPVFPSEIETLGHVDIELDGGHLPLAADCVLRDEIDLGTIKRCLTRSSKTLRRSMATTVGRAS
jgi:hypothetical protein